MPGRRFATTNLVAVGTSIVAVAVAIALIGAPRSGSTAASPAPSASVVGVIAPSPAVGASQAPTATASSSSAEKATPSAAPPAASATPSPIPVPVPTIVFDSAVHDYQVRYPDAWSVKASHRRPDPDVISSSDYRWTGTARRVASGTSVEAFVAANAPSRCNGATWDVTEIDGRRTLRRAGCGHVDAHVMVGRDVYSFSLEGAGPYEPVLLFGRIAATIQLPEPFASRINDFTLSIPPAWEVRAATEPDDPDRFYGPRHLDFDVMTHRESGDKDPVFWAATHIRPRSSHRSGQQYCAGRSSMPPVKDPRFRASTIDGHPAAIRSSCGYVDAVVLVGDRVVQLTLISPHDGAGGDDAAFAQLARRLDLGTPDGIGPVWSETFRSRLHGYVLRYPRDWKVSPASDAPENDVFRALHARTSLSVTVRPKPRSQDLDAFAEQLLPHHAKDGGCQWNSPGIIWIPGGSVPFERTVIAGRRAVVRIECDFVDAVVDLDDQALVLVLHSAKRIPGAEQTLFDLFTDALEVTAPST